MDGVSTSVDRGKTLGLVGESGSGKSVTALSVIGLTRLQNAEVSGQVLFDGTDLMQLSSERLQSIRGPRIAMIFQDPLSSLHPLYRVGWQIEEAILAHEQVSRRAARARAVDAMRAVEMPSPAELVDRYPNELSGGMRQRAMIAMALVLNPDVLIADEPTTALDVTVQAQILELIRSLQHEFDTAVVLITHDFGVIAETADEVAVSAPRSLAARAGRRRSQRWSPAGHQAAARSANFAYRRRNESLMVSVGPLRCLATCTSASPC